MGARLSIVWTDYGGIDEFLTCLLKPKNIMQALARSVVVPLGSPGGTNAALDGCSTSNSTPDKSDLHNRS